MKSIILAALVSLVTVSAQARLDHEGGEFGTVYCIQHRGYSPIKNNMSHLVVMKQLKKGPKGRLYSFELYRKNLKNGERALIVNDRVTVYTEDVMANFRGFKKGTGPKTFVSIYMDELNQSSVTTKVDGEKFEVNLICRPNSQGLQLWNADR